MVHDIGAPNVKIHFDTFHANIEERHPAEALRSVARELGHVHISENDRGIPGTGHNDWRGVLMALKDIGYEGWMTIEPSIERITQARSLPDPQLTFQMDIQNIVTSVMPGPTTPTASSTTPRSTTRTTAT